jgi:hypothetical protein
VEGLHVVGGITTVSKISIILLNIMFCMPVMLICIMYSVVHMNYC